MIRNLRFAAVHIALAAMMLRALLPAGWMPAAIAGGAPLVVCTMDGPVSLVLGPGGKPLKHQPSQDDARHHEMCPFAAAPHLASPSTVAGVALPAHVTFASFDVSHAALLAPQSRHSPQSPRAPPALA
jgi:hypothetical protein